MTFAVVLAIPAVALADNVSNNLDASVDAVAETMPLNVGGPNGTTQLYIDTTNGDGKNGCNLTGSTALGLSVSSSNTSVATVSPSSVTFGSCGETKTLTVTPVAAGSTTISVSQTSNSTAGSFDLEPATFTVNVTAAAPANTAPQVSVSGVDAGAEYDKGSVPDATCEVTDAEDGTSSFAATLSAITGPYASDGIGSQTASCSYTDEGPGTPLEASASETYSINDPSDPVITKVVTPASPDGSNGWYTSDVKVDWTVSDPESPNSLQTTGCVDQNITSDQAATTYSCSATSAGGSAGPETVTIKRDATAPTVNPASVTNNVWRNTDLSQAFTSSDGTSGLADSTNDASFTLTASAESANATTPTVVSRTVYDLAGNSTTRSVSAKIDLTDPLISGADVNDTTWRNTDLSRSFTASDALSGLLNPLDDSFTLTTSGESPDASTPVTASKTVSDNAGNSDTRTISAFVDKTKPVITDDSANNAPTGTAGLNGWYTSAVTNTFKATDGLSGFVSPLTDSHTFTKSSGATEEGPAVKINSGSVSDKAGNPADAKDSQAFKIDLNNPTVNITGPAEGSKVDLCASGIPSPSFTASDTLLGSGVNTSLNSGGFTTQPNTATGVGAYTYAAQATDFAGRQGSATRNYSVVYGANAFSGVQQPINASGTRSAFKLGSTIPVKFQLRCGTTPINNAVAKLWVASSTTGLTPP